MLAVEATILLLQLRSLRMSIRSMSISCSSSLMFKCGRKLKPLQYGFGIGPNSVI